MTTLRQWSGIILLASLAACVSTPRSQTEVTVLLNPLGKAVTPPPGGAACGNGLLETAQSEQCDDGNIANGDGCSATCTIETTPNTAQVLPCRVDVGREEATVHPQAGLQGYVLQLNDTVRAITGLPVDIFIGEGGGTGVLRCTVPATGKAVTINASTGAAIAPFLQLRGMPPINRFNDLLRPGVDEVLKGPIQLLPPSADSVSPSISAALSALPDDGIDAQPLLSVIPNATVNIVPGMYQINNVLRVEMGVGDLPAAEAGTTKAVANPGDKVLSLQAQWVAGPDACAWATDSCPDEKRVPNIQDRHIDPNADVIEPLRKLVDAKRAAGDPITMDVFDELFNQKVAQYDTSEYLHIQYLASGVSVHQLVTSGFSEAQGGCSCRLDHTGRAAPISSAALGLVGLTIAGLLSYRRRAVVLARAD